MQTMDIDYIPENMHNIDIEYNPWNVHKINIQYVSYTTTFTEDTSRLFTQPFIQVQIKENIKAPRHWPLCGEFTGDRQMDSNAENVSIWWRHPERGNHGISPEILWSKPVEYEQPHRTN